MEVFRRSKTKLSIDRVRLNNIGKKPAKLTPTSHHKLQEVLIFSHRRANQFFYIVHHDNHNFGIFSYQFQTRNNFRILQQVGLYSCLADEVSIMEINLFGLFRCESILEVVVKSKGRVILEYCVGDFVALL